MEIATEEQRRELVEKIKKVRKKILRFKDELKDLRAVGHARADAVEKRIVNAGNRLACLYFEWETGARLTDENVGPADEPPDMWSRRDTMYRYRPQGGGSNGERV